MRVETITYQADVELVGTLYLPDGDKPAPGVLVNSDIVGIGDHSRERAERLAQLGYAAFAADLHGGGGTIPIADIPATLQSFYANPDVTAGRGEAALAVLKSRPEVDGTRLASMGFCYGGMLSFELARRGNDLAAVIGFHSRLTTCYPGSASRIKGKVLACIGSEDPEVPTAQRNDFEAEMREAGLDWQLHVYGGVYHTFTDWRCDQMGVPHFARYDAAADRRSWAAMCGLLEETLRGDGGPAR